MKTNIFRAIPFLTGWLIASSVLVSCSYLPEKQDPPSLVTVYEYRDYIEINPTSNQYSRTGLVFYPGGLVDPHAYIEPLTKFALMGKAHKVVIVKMPGNLAVLDGNQAAWVYDDFPDVQQWVIAGHSLGGVMACSVVKKYPDYFKGIVLMAAYPQGSADLSGWAGSVLSLRGEFDGQVDSLTIAEKASLLPPGIRIHEMTDFPSGSDPKTVYYTIPGGNHSQFGDYGHQKGDGTATISPEDQWDDVAFLMLRFFIYNGWEYEK
jgi:dienelactone hydrolase